MKKNLLLFFALFLISRYSFALVDYTEEAPQPPKASNNIRRIAPPSSTVTTQASSSPTQNYSPSGMFEIGAKYGQMDVEMGEASGKLNVTRFDVHFETSYNIWLDASYSMASFDSAGNVGQGSSQKGNPHVLLGVNWLDFGGAGERANIDFVAGANIGQKDSLFATSRTDKIFGVETAKRFNTFVFGLGYRVWLTDTADNVEETNIGNVQRLSATLGWMVSPDIQFALEAATVSIGVGEGDNALEQKTSFGALAPSLHLGISPLVSLELGAVFRTKRLRDEELLGARLWSLPGSYGNMMYAGLGISL